MMKHGLVALIIFSTLLLKAQQTEFNSNNGMALEGYDPVSYFIGKPLKGSPDISAIYNGITYRFSSEANRDVFSGSPERYLPEYGGWCAYAMGLDGERVSVDPETYKIRDGRLFLFYNSLLNNTLKKWNKNEGELLPKADSNWNNQVKTE